MRNNKSDEVSASTSEINEAEETVGREIKAIDDKSVEISGLVNEAVKATLGAYDCVSSLLGKTDKTAIENDCIGYIKYRIIALCGENPVKDKRLASARENSAETPVSLKICMLADKRTDKNYTKEYLRCVAEILKLVK